MERINLQNETITLEELDIVCTLGRGTFGHVFLTHHKKNNTHYALKTVARSKIAKHKLQMNLSLERSVLL
jgi:serine/threonine protein kinase